MSQNIKDSPHYTPCSNCLQGFDASKIKADYGEFSAVYKGNYCCAKCFEQIKFKNLGK